jgi:hypothetical protein
LDGELTGLSPDRVKIIRPLLHHLASGRQMRGAVILVPIRIAHRVRKLVLDIVWPYIPNLVEDRARHRPETVPGHLILREAMRRSAALIALSLSGRSLGAGAWGTAGMNSRHVGDEKRAAGKASSIHTRFHTRCVVSVANATCHIGGKPELEPLSKVWLTETCARQPVAHGLSDGHDQTP